MKNLLLIILIIWPALTFAGPSGGESGGLSITAKNIGKVSSTADFIDFEDPSITDKFDDSDYILSPLDITGAVAADTHSNSDMTTNAEILFIDAIGAIKAEQEVEWFESADENVLVITDIPVDLKETILNVTDENHFKVEGDQVEIEVKIKDIFGLESNKTLNWEISQWAY